MASAGAGAAAKWNERYGETPSMRYGEAANAWLAGPDGVKKFVPKGGRVIELASGEGRNTVWLAEQGYKAEGVDISSAGVLKSRAFADSRGLADTIKFSEGDATSFGEDDAFDGVVCVFAHVPTPLKAALLANIVRILKPGGHLVGEWYTPTHVERKDDPAVEWGFGGPPTKDACETSPAAAARGEAIARPLARQIV